MSYNLEQFSDAKGLQARTIKTDGISRTMPDMGVSLQQILNRVKQGLPLPQNRSVRTTNLDLQNADLVDLQNMSQKAGSYLLDLKGTIDTEREAQESIKQLELVNTLVEEGVKARVGEGSKDK